MAGVEIINGLVEDSDDKTILNSQKDTIIKYQNGFLFEKKKFLRKKKLFTELIKQTEVK